MSLILKQFVEISFAQMDSFFDEFAEFKEPYLTFSFERSLLSKGEVEWVSPTFFAVVFPRAHGCTSPFANILYTVPAKMYKIPPTINAPCHSFLLP